MIELGYPCPEDVVSMGKTECGHYCTTCSKDIMDFRDKTNEETKKILAENKSITCGIFRPDQMKNEAKDHTSSLFRLAFAAVFFLGFNYNMLFAQDCEPICTDEVQVEVVESGMVSIDGKVFGVEGEILSNASISFYMGDTYYNVRSDSTGYFEIPVGKEIVGEDINIYAGYPGLQGESIVVNKVRVGEYHLTVNLTKYEYLRGKVAAPGMMIRHD